MSDNAQPQPEQVVEVVVPPEFKEQLKDKRIDDVIKDLDLLYQTELRNLIDVSTKYKQKIEESKTKTKDHYYSSKLTKNNEKIYDMLIQYEQSKALLMEYKKQKEAEQDQTDDEH